MPKPLSQKQRKGRVSRLRSQRKRQLDEDLCSLARTEWGRRLLYWLIEEVCQIRAIGYTEDVQRIRDGVHAGMRLAFMEGRQYVGIHLSNELERLAPAEQALMVGERLRETQRELALNVGSHDEDDDDDGYDADLYASG